MRWIDKGETPPRALEEYLAIQQPTGVNLDYESFSRKGELREELKKQQFGLCAFTGVPIDDRLGNLAGSGGPPRIKSHNAHLKPQSICRKEVIARGGNPGGVVGEDMNYRNIVAALLVEGAEREMFGAAAQKHRAIPVKPTDPDCERKFRFDAGGGISGFDSDANETIGVLKLDHPTLVGWRRAAIEVFTEPGVDPGAVVTLMENPNNGQLPGYCFAIKQVAESLIA